MNRLFYYIFSGLVLGFLLLQAGCNDLENVTAPEISQGIKSVIPARAPYGARVLIGGTGFGSNQDNLELFFNESEAVVEVLNDSTIITRVPKDATNGPVEVVVNGETLTGPLFTIDTSRNLWLDITGINPDEGRYGDTIEITGAGFSEDPEKNNIYFGEVSAKVTNASENSLITVVPEEAQTGPIMVVVGKDTTISPTFTLIEPRTLQVSVLTEGTDQDPDGYVFSVEGKDDRSVLTNDEVVYNEIFESEVQVTLSGVAPNCRAEGEKTRNISLSTGSMAEATFNVDCTIDLRGKIVFGSDRDGNDELYAQNADGTGVRRLTETPDFDEGEPAIAPDGLQVAFTANTESGRHIFIMDSDGSNLRQFTEAGYWAAPSWSPNGDKLVFEGGVEIKDLYTINTNGENLQNITNTEYNSEQSPDWSPDGKRILFQNMVDGSWKIFAMSEDGTKKNQVINSKTHNKQPEWSPSGDKIILLRFNQKTSEDEIVIYNVSTNEIESVIPNSGPFVGSPTWSPEGTEIAYTVYSDGVYQLHVYNIEANSIVYDPWTFDNDETPHWNYR